MCFYQSFCVFQDLAVTLRVVSVVGRTAYGTVWTGCDTTAPRPAGTQARQEITLLDLHLVGITWSICHGKLLLCWTSYWIWLNYWLNFWLSFWLNIWLNLHSHIQHVGAPGVRSWINVEIVFFVILYCGSFSGMIICSKCPMKSFVC